MYKKTIKELKQYLTKEKNYSYFELLILAFKTCIVLYTPIILIVVIFYTANCFLT